MRMCLNEKFCDASSACAMETIHQIMALNSACRARQGRRFVG
jgi:hypothetical protein